MQLLGVVICQQVEESWSLLQDWLLGNYVFAKDGGLSMLMASIKFEFSTSVADGAWTHRVQG